MANPIIVGLGMQALSGGAASAISPAMRKVQYIANNISPNLEFEITDTIRCFTMGHFGLANLKLAVKKQGLDLDRATLRSKEVVGVQNGKYVPIGEVLAPQDRTWENAYLRSYTANLANDEIVQLYYREQISLPMTDWLFGRNGVTDRYLQNFLLELGQQIPGPSDLVSFAVREAFTPDIVQKYRYMDELPLDVLPWFKKQGLGGEIGIPRPAGVDSVGNPIPAGNATWFDAYWWSHWQLPSVGEGQNMVFRYYPTSRFGPSPDYTPETSFTEDDLSTLLKTSDYPTYWRKRLEGIAYLPLQKRDLQRMFDLDLISEAEVYHSYRAIGYNDRLATKLTDFTKQKKIQDLIKTTQGWTEQTILKYYKLGIIDLPTAEQRLKDIGFKPSAVTDIINKANLDLKADNAEKTITLLHKAFMQGNIGTNEVRTVLTNAGIAPSMTQSYLDHWSVERQYTYKEISTGEIVKAYQLDLIDENTMVLRLYNLGHSERDVTMIVLNAKKEKLDKLNKQIFNAANAQAKQAEKSAKETVKEAKAKQAALDKAAAKKEKLAAKQATLAEKGHKKLIAVLTSAYTDKNIHDMYTSKVLTEQQVRDILTIKEWSPESINKFILGELTKPKEGDTSNAIPGETQAKSSTPVGKPTNQ